MNAELAGQEPGLPDVRTCIQVGSLGVRCVDCQIPSCDILQAGVQLNELTTAVDTQQREISELRLELGEAETRRQTTARERDAEREQRIADQRDPVIPDFLTTLGVMARINNDPILAGEIVEGRAGVVYIDLRGLHAKNEEFGDFVGDYDLKMGGLRLKSAHEQPEAERASALNGGGLRLETALEQRKQEDQPERRMHPTNVRDIGYRGSRADELVVLVRNVSPRELREIAGRVEELFSVDRAIRDSVAGELPLVATVAHAHIEELQLDYANPIDIFQAVHDMARTRHGTMKTEQYAEMWDLARRTARTEFSRNIRKPSDPRLIFKYFMEYCCPDFNATAGTYYQQRGVQVKEPPQSQ